MKSLGNGWKRAQEAKIRSLKLERDLWLLDKQLEHSRRMAEINYGPALKLVQTIEKPSWFANLWRSL